MYTEVTREEAVRLYLKDAPVFATDGGLTMEDLNSFSLRQLKNNEGLRFVADINKEETKPDEKNKIKKVLEKQKKMKPEGKEPDKKKIEQLKSQVNILDKTREKTFGDLCFEMHEQGLTNSEIAEKLNRKPTAVANALYAKRKKAKAQNEKSDFEWDEPEEKKGPRLPQKTVKMISCITDSEKSVDIASAAALMEAGWTLAKVADEFNVYENDLEEALEKYKAENE